MKVVMTCLALIVLLNTVTAAEGDETSGVTSTDPQNNYSPHAIVDVMPPSKSGLASPSADDSRPKHLSDSEPLQLGDISPSPDTLDPQSLPKAADSSPSVSSTTQDTPNDIQSIDERITLDQWAVLDHHVGWGVQDFIDDEKKQLTNNSAYRLQDDIRSMVGEDIYAKMVWMYFDLKAVDNQIYSTLAQYGWGRHGVFGLQLPVVTQDNPIQSIFALVPSNPNEAYNPKTTSIAANESIKDVWRDRQAVALGEKLYQDGFFFKISEYLTFANLLYVMALWVLLKLLFKAFKFLLHSI